MVLRIAPRQIFRWHLATIIALGIANLLVVIIDQFDIHIGRFMRLSEEGNFPTLFSTAAIAAAALVAWRIASAILVDGAERRAWRILAVLMTFMAVDEGAQIHEMLNHHGLTGPEDGVFSRVGIFPYAAIALLLSIWLFPFWVRQSASVRTGIAFGGICYVTAAAGVELLENASWAAGISQYHPISAALFMCEELGEMLAVAILLRAFLARLAELREPTVVLVGTMRPLP
jgi:hypothetical protein